MKHNSLPKYYIFLLLTVIIWGTGLVGTKMAMDYGIPPGMVIMLRMAIGALFMLILFFRQIRQLTGKMIRHGIIGGILLGLCSAFQTVGMSTTAVSTNAFITSTYVVFVPILCRIFMKRKISRQIVAAVALVVIGMMVLTRVAESGFIFQIGDILALVGAVLFAGQIAYVDYAGDDIESGSFTFVELCVAAVVALVYFLIAETPITITPMFNYGLLVTLYLGIVFTAVAFYLQCRAQQHIPSPKAALVLSLEGVSASVCSVIAGLEVVHPSLIVGGGLILAAVVLAQIPLKKMARPGGA